MPLFTYRCACGAVEEELVRQGREVPDVIDCPCGRGMERDRVYPITPIGPIWSNTEQFEAQLLSPAQRASGQRVTGPTALAALERRLNVVAIDRNSPAARTAQADSADYIDTFNRIERTDGTEAALTFQAVEEAVAEGASLSRSALTGIINDLDMGEQMMLDGKISPEEATNADPIPRPSAADQSLAAHVLADLGLSGHGPEHHAAGPA